MSGVHFILYGVQLIEVKPINIPRLSSRTDSIDDKNLLWFV